MNFNDVRLLNESIQNAGSDALRRRAMSQEHEALMQRLALEAQLRDIQGQRYDAQSAHYQTMEEKQDNITDLLKQKNATADKLADTKIAASKRPFYIYDEKSGNAFGVSGTFDEAEAKMNEIMQKQPDATLSISTKEPVGKVKRTTPQGEVYLSDKEAARFDTEMEKIKQAGAPKEVAPYTKTEIHQIKNPALRPDLGMTNVPPTISVTNTTQRLPLSQPAAPPAPVAQPKAMTPDVAAQYLQKFGKDRAKAEAAAKQDGYSW